MTETRAHSAPPSPDVPAGRRLPRWAVALLGAVLVGTWTIWGFHAYRAHVPAVSTAELRTDLASGHVLTYVGLSEAHTGRAWPTGDEPTFSTAPIPEPGAPWTSYDRPIIAVAYHVADVRSPIRVIFVAPFGESGSGAVGARELVQVFEAAGVQPDADFAPGAQWRATPSAVSAFFWGRVAWLTALIALVAIRPTRGTRWFWFWLFQAPFGLGVLSYVAGECLRPRRPGPAHAGRSEKRPLRGIVGFAIVGLAASVVSLLTAQLA